MSTVKILCGGFDLMYAHARKYVVDLIFCLLICCQTGSGLSAQEAQEKALPVFEDGQAQIVEAFKDKEDWIVEVLWVETEFDSDSDGKLDRMQVDVTRQKQTETEGLKVPVVYETSPYYSGTGANGRQYFWSPKQELNSPPPERQYPPEIPFQAEKEVISRSLTRVWVPRGFAVVHSCSPGTGRSQGCPTVGGENESLAPKAVIDWLCGRGKGYTSVDGSEEVFASWCTGKIGMTGTSYNGTLPIAAATTGVAGLEAVIPIAPNTSYYHYYRSHGLIRHPGGYMGEDIDVLYDFINSGNPEKENIAIAPFAKSFCKQTLIETMVITMHFWAGRDYSRKLDNYRAATLMAHAFNDWNVMPEHSVRIYELLKKKEVPCQAFFHQGGHGGAPPLKMMNRWFTRYLYGVENGVENDPKAWIVRENGSIRKPTEYPDYPHPDAELVTWFPSGAGEEVGVLTRQRQSAGQQTLIDDFNIRGSELAQLEESKNRLLFVTQRSSNRFTSQEPPNSKSVLACSKPAANLSVWLVSLPWKQPTRKLYDNIITRGWADPQNHSSLTESEPLVPGQFYELDFELQPDDQIIPVGQQIGLMIFSSDKDFTLWPEPGTELTIDLDNTSLRLPVVGGQPRAESAIP